jgi:thiol-disulfide isomerase/thioredoxin
MTSHTGPKAVSSLRRRLLLGAAGGAALVGGAWWSLRVRAPDPAAEAFWARSFETPQGGQLSMQSLRGRPLLVNFWATWCAPCVRELPEIDRFYRDFAAEAWQVVGLAIDGPTPVREFLGRFDLSFPIGLAGLDGTALVRQLGNDRGGLPFSVAFGADGRVIHRKLGETSYAELAGWARAAN